MKVPAHKPEPTRPIGQKVADNLEKFGRLLVESKSHSFNLVRAATHKEIGMILTGTADGVVQMLFEAMQQNPQVKAVIYSAVEAYQVDQISKMPADQRPKAKEPVKKSKLILEKF